ncbi:chromosome segregation protein SMC [Sulfoacidibacillus thermotolerans]|uniref:Chromosome partition protein Smc n=1 Tax=Sulfoacidibacillus thermotolerans TaxID=1765684 RepID=A0A2U3D7V1_SULT2|nr:chromosome segregation protein SMC [Sulfoacidibacillus thermotolerans]PWI57355.1 chromosome segregation protein SMC [Sulfoacidibacillus thermotolerans]
MFLKRLDVIGFKSFADRVELEIAPGVTAVVGPNGSGKSNISDAIRWVLGEQSARSLRGAKMEDVIFSGSQARKPVNFCEVTLTLDNHNGILPVDFAEVSVTRRVYRSGESEYLINKTPCRLRDIAELFMDTGVGREAYSIIGQGRIEEILSNKSDERRGVFEEAAGIVKFKWRKREAERKLAEADQNLVRVNDVLAELAQQVDSLAEKAEIAKQYKMVASATEKLQIAVLAAEISELSQKRMALVAERDELLQKIELQERKEKEAESLLKQVKERFEKVEVEFSELSEQFVQATARVEQCVAERRLALERQESAILQLDELRAQRERVASRQIALEANLLSHRAEVYELEQRVANLRGEVRRKLDEQDGSGLIAQLRERMTEARASMIEVMRRQAGERNQQKTLLQERDQKLRKLERHEFEQSELTKKVTDVENKLSLCENELTRLANATQEISQATDEVYKTLAIKEAELRTDTAKVEQLERQKVEILSRHRTLQDLQRDLDGYASGPKAVLRASQKSELTGIHGVVADLIQVSKEYELAIETALGGSLQHLVVESEIDARHAIDFLKKRQLGRATFLPLETIAGRRLAQRDLQAIDSLPGFIGLASDLVQVDRRYQAIVESLLGNVVIAEQLAHANAIAKHLHYRVRIVTLGGDVVHPGGSMTGGSTGKRSVGLLGRAREIQALEERARDVSVQINEVSRHQQACETAVREMRERRAQLQGELGKIAEAARVQELHQNTYIAEQKALMERIQMLLRDRELTNTELQACEAQLTEVENTLEKVGEEVRQSEAQIKVLEEELLQAEAKVSGHNERLTELRVALAEQEEALRRALLAGQQLESQLGAVGTERERIETEQQAMIVRIAQLRSKVEAEELQATCAQEDKQQVETVLESRREERALLLKKLEHVAQVEQTIRAESDKLRQRMHQVEVSASKMDGELETKSDHLRTEFQLGYELAKQQYPLAESLVQARSKLAALRQELEVFGDVNVGAIEEYELVRERYGFLQNEASDLTAAKQQLTSLIAEIDEEMASRFKETFAAIRQRFQEVFCSLFEGGKADVFLIDEEDPLHSGIEITAEPPGKKMQTLSLLSGGERALTALALLFAILHVKPVPFCVLDEVEAALDEANVSRFAEYLQSFSRQTQFVVITHRRGTMEAADVLYGVTMQDSGVSKVVSVRVLEEEITSEKHLA